MLLKQDLQKDAIVDASAHFFLSLRISFIACWYSGCIFRVCFSQRSNHPLPDCCLHVSSLIVMCSPFKYSLVIASTDLSISDATNTESHSILVGDAVGGVLGARLGVMEGEAAVPVLIGDAVGGVLGARLGVMEGEAAVPVLIGDEVGGVLGARLGVMKAYSL